MSIIKLLPLKKLAKGVDCRSKEIYQLKDFGDGNYNLIPFKSIVFRGNLEDYLDSNESILCYIMEDDEIRGKIEERIKSYNVIEESEGGYKLTTNPIHVKAKTRAH